MIYSLLSTILQLPSFVDANSVEYMIIDKDVYQNGWQNPFPVNKGEEEKTSF